MARRGHPQSAATRAKISASLLARNSGKRRGQAALVDYKKKNSPRTVDAKPSGTHKPKATKKVMHFSDLSSESQKNILQGNSKAYRGPKGDYNGPHSKEAGELRKHLIANSNLNKELASLGPHSTKSQRDKVYRKHGYTDSHGNVAKAKPSGTHAKKALPEAKQQRLTLADLPARSRYNIVNGAMGRTDKANREVEKATDLLTKRNKEHKDLSWQLNPGYSRLSASRDRVDAASKQSHVKAMRALSAQHNENIVKAAATPSRKKSSGSHASKSVPTTGNPKPRVLTDAQKAAKRERARRRRAARG